MFSTSLVVENGRSVREVLTDVYAALGLDFEPSTAGAAADAAPGLTVDDVTDELLAQYQQRFLKGGHTGNDTYGLATMAWSELLAEVPPV